LVTTNALATAALASRWSQLQRRLIETHRANPPD
jgi:hypothetical protein